MDEIRRRLEKSYRRAVYVVTTPSKEISFRIGEFSLALDALLETFAAVNFAFITADNPHSKVLSATANKVRRAALEKLLNTENAHYLAGYGTDDDESWSREASLLIFDLERERACAIARKFGQNAIVYGEKGREIELIWCAAETAN